MQEKVKINIYETTLLSEKEVMQLLKEDERKCKFLNERHPWLLRSKKDDNNTIMYVDGDGNLEGDTGYGWGIRPALKCVIYGNRQAEQLTDKYVKISGNSYIIKKSLAYDENDYVLISSMIIGRCYCSQAKRCLEEWTERFKLSGEHDVEIYDKPQISARYSVGVPVDVLVNECDDAEMFYKIDWLSGFLKNWRCHLHESWDAKVNRSIGRIDMTQNSLYKRTGFNRKQLQWIVSENVYLGKAKDVLGVKDCRYLSIEKLNWLRGMLGMPYRRRMLKDIKKIYGESYVFKVKDIERTIAPEYDNRKGKTPDDIEKLYDCLVMCLMYYKDSNEKIPFPKIKSVNDLSRFHDAMVELTNTRKSKQMETRLKKYQEGFDRNVPRWNGWTYENDKYVVLAPEKPAELVIEGMNLHHCVGSYIEAVSNGETNILFIRQKNNVDKPFFTAEITNDGTFRQIKGYANRDAGTEPGLKAFIKEWATAKNIAGTHYSKALPVGAVI